jgi:hypothetical protein
VHKLDDDRCLLRPIAGLRSDDVTNSFQEEKHAQAIVNRIRLVAR